MKMIKTLITASFALFLMTGIAAADDLDDLDVTIRMMESDDDANEVEHELSLPESASDSAREHAEDDGHENEGEHHSNDDGRDDDGHDEDGHDEDREDHDDDRDDHDDDKDDNDDDKEDHEEDGESDDDSTPGT